VNPAFATVLHALVPFQAQQLSSVLLVFDVSFLPGCNKILCLGTFVTDPNILTLSVVDRTLTYLLVSLLAY